MQPIDLVKWACDYLRDKIPKGVQVGNRHPADYVGDYPLIVVTDTGGYGMGYAHYRMGIGITIMGHDYSINDNTTILDLARQVYAILTDYSVQSDRNTPIASVLEDSSLLPTVVAQEAPYERVYCTCEYVVRGNC